VRTDNCDTRAVICTRIIYGMIRYGRAAITIHLIPVRTCTHTRTRASAQLRRCHFNSIIIRADDGAIAWDLTNFCYSLIAAIMKSGINRSRESFANGTRLAAISSIVIASLSRLSSRYCWLRGIARGGHIDTREYSGAFTSVFLIAIDRPLMLSTSLTSAGDTALRSFNNSLNSLP